MSISLSRFISNRSLPRREGRGRVFIHFFFPTILFSFCKFEKNFSKFQKIFLKFQNIFLNFQNENLQ